MLLKKYPGNTCLWHTHIQPDNKEGRGGCENLKNLLMFFLGGCSFNHLYSFCWVSQCIWKSSKDEQIKARAMCSPLQADLSCCLLIQYLEVHREACARYVCASVMFVFVCVCVCAFEFAFFFFMHMNSHVSVCSDVREVELMDVLTAALI